LWEVDKALGKESGIGNAVVSMRRTIGRDNIRTLFAKVKKVGDKSLDADSRIFILNYMLLRGYRE
jgi:hypothetical protein